MSKLFEEFTHQRIETGETEISYWVGGTGAPLLLLHGYPQTHVMWHKIAGRLARNYTVVAADLRGYGDSGKPSSGPDVFHLPYSKHKMAADMVTVLRYLVFEKFNVCGHDRGGRVAHRMALDHPDKVLRIAVLDIVPTYKIYMETDRHIAEDYYHWFFLIQPFDYPERMIGNDVPYYLSKKMGKYSFGKDVFTSAAAAEYLRCFSNPETIHCSCEDYRAAATIDLEHDNVDIGTKLTMPLLVRGAKKERWNATMMYLPHGANRLTT